MDVQWSDLSIRGGSLCNQDWGVARSRRTRYVSCRLRSLGSGIDISARMARLWRCGPVRMLGSVRRAHLAQGVVRLTNLRWMTWKRAHDRVRRSRRLQGLKARGLAARGP